MAARTTLSSSSLDRFFSPLEGEPDLHPHLPAAKKSWFVLSPHNDIGASGQYSRYRHLISLWADHPDSPHTATFEPALYAIDLNVAFTADPLFEQAWHDLRAIRPFKSHKTDDEFADILTPFIMECVHDCAHPAQHAGRIPLITVDVDLFTDHLRSRLTAHDEEDIAVILAVTGLEPVIETVLRTTRRLSHEHDVHRRLRQHALIIRHMERLMTCADLPGSDRDALSSFYAQFDEDMDTYLQLTGGHIAASSKQPHPQAHPSFFQAPLTSIYKGCRAASRLFSHG